MSTRLSSWKAGDVASRLSKSGKGRSKKSGDGWLAPCPAHDDQTPSLSLTNTSEGRLLWHCFGGCESEDVRKALVAVLGGESQPEASEQPREREKVEDNRAIVYPVPSTAHVTIDDFQHKTYGAPSRVWTYKTAMGEIGGWIARYDIGEGDKEIIPYVWSRHALTGVEEVRMKAMPEPRPLYNLDQIANRPDAIIGFAEGEKAADAASKMFPDWVVTTIPGGSNAARLADLSVLANRIVVIMADHDGPGYAFALKIIEMAPNTADIRMMLWPEKWPLSRGGDSYVMEKGDDAHDHAEAGWTRDMLREAVKESGRPLIHRIEYLPAPLEVIHYVDNKPS